MIRDHSTRSIVSNALGTLRTREEIDGTDMAIAVSLGRPQFADIGSAIGSLRRLSSSDYNHSGRGEFHVGQILSINLKSRVCYIAYSRMGVNEVL